MQSLAVLALIIGLVMLLRWLGAPARRRPEADLPPPTDDPIA